MCLRDHSIYSVTPVSPRLTPLPNSDPLPSSRLLTWLITANMDVLKQCHSGYESWHLEGSTARAGMVNKMCLSSWFRFGYLMAYYLYITTFSGTYSHPVFFFSMVGLSLANLFLNSSINTPPLSFHFERRLSLYCNNIGHLKRAFGHLEVTLPNRKCKTFTSVGSTSCFCHSLV